MKVKLTNEQSKYLEELLDVINRNRDKIVDDIFVDIEIETIRYLYILGNYDREFKTNTIYPLGTGYREYQPTEPIGEVVNKWRQFYLKYRNYENN